MKTVTGNIIDIKNKRIFPGKIEYDVKIKRIKETLDVYDNYILPGFIDSHIHIESSMLVPSEFAKMAVSHGTVATVSDPHEIANVLGVDGIKFMIENGQTVPFKFFFGVPSCVPATAFETSGGKINAADAETLFKNENLLFLSEMMNVPGVLFEDEHVFEMINMAKKYNRKIDGHAPGLLGADLKTYINAGITTDHEATSYEEGLEKIKNGMKIQIREGSAAKNFDALIGLLKDFSDECMFCSDDLHPDDLSKGHINLLVKRAVEKGYDIFDILKAAVLNPVKHYGLSVGLLKEGDFADFILVDNLKDFNVKETVINGQSVYKNEEILFDSNKINLINKFKANRIDEESIIIKSDKKDIPLIKVIDGQLITFKETFENSYGILNADVDNDILKIVVINRYENSKPAVGFINGFGLKEGAIASSVAHDSHNIIVVGTNDKDICNAANLIIDSKGGISAVTETMKYILPLPVGGIMSKQTGVEISRKYQEIDKIAKQMGSKLCSPYMTLSFMALLVIPYIKIGDKGLFDSEKFEFINL
jgi:adenine deaminase